jgi:hypothetical protein
MFWHVISCIAAFWMQRNTTLGTEKLLMVWNLRSINVAWNTGMMVIISLWQSVGSKVILRGTSVHMYTYHPPPPPHAHAHACMRARTHTHTDAYKNRKESALKTVTKWNRHNVSCLLCQKCSNRNPVWPKSQSTRNTLIIILMPIQCYASQAVERYNSILSCAINTVYLILNNNLYIQ